MKLVVQTLALAAAVCGSPHFALAHFPFLATNDEGQVVLFFGENLANRNYKVPPAVEKAEIFKIDREVQPEKLATKVVESEPFVGLASSTQLKPGQAAATQIRYGVYHGTQLDYYCVHLASVPQSAADSTQGKLDHALKADVVSVEKGIEVSVTWQGVPLKSTKVTLYCQDGHSEGEEQTDSDGKVLFSHQQLEDGLSALLVGHKVKEAGQWNGQEFETCSHYLTVTFPKPPK